MLPWIEGEDAWAAPSDDEEALARDLGTFVARLRSRPLPLVSHPGPSSRGGPLAWLDRSVRWALDRMGEEEGREAAATAWEACLALPRDAGEARWFHGDLQPFNLILRDGRLAAVIDWGCLGTGDPACDLAAGWQVFDAPARETFREATGADEGSWLRGRAWALAKAIQAIPHYRKSNPTFAAFARRTLGRVLAD